MVEKGDLVRRSITMALSTVILVGSMAMSYGNQSAYLFELGIGWGSWILPLMLDLMVLTANVAVGVMALTPGERRKIRRIMWAALLASAWTNFAGGHGWKAGLYHASAVFLYLAAEKIVTIVVEAIIRTRATERAAATAVQPAATEVKADDAEAEDLPAAPVSPGLPPAPAEVGARGAYGPRDGERYSDRHARRQRRGK